MKTFHSRKSEDYLARLRDLLSYDTLIENAITLNNPKNIRGKSYDKFVKIDYVGVSASTLLDGSNILGDANVYNEFKDLLLRSDKLHSKNIFVKVRFLFDYQYSVATYSRIQAETSFLRASMSEPIYSRDFELSEQLDEYVFNGSFSVTTQQANLRHLQNIERELHFTHGWNSKDNPSSITLRFTPISSGFCGLFINNTLFCDAYLLAKARREDNKLFFNTPLIEIDKNNESDKEAFEAFEDHFRYLWELDVTLDCEDATFYQRDAISSLGKLRSPQNVDFENKAERICLIRGICDDDKAITGWKKQISKKFNQYCADLSPAIPNETVFITCSWKKEGDGIGSPNSYAQLLHKYLTEDFVQTPTPIFSVKIMEATPSEFLSNQLYESLDSTTVGIILMTRDIESEGKYYCKPNVYHELGYLMKQLGKKRMIILKESQVVPPSNIQDIIRFDFEVDKMTFRYHEVIAQLHAVSNIPKIILLRALENHLDRLNQLLKDGNIEAREFKVLETKINQLISNYKHK
jgi:hypothetical protein